ncbi:MAG: hypothetical protein AB1384_06380 [Actinomycetota bacterium]
MAIDTCSECRVPRYITSDHRWLSSGAIVQASAEKTRPYFLECENLDPLFGGIEGIIGEPIEPIVIAVKQMNVKTYIEGMLPEETREMLWRREIDWRPINDTLRLVARLTGYGRYEVVDYQSLGADDDFITESISDPLSIPYACGTMAAAFEILFARELGVLYRKASPDLIEIICFPEGHAEEYKGRFRMDSYGQREGAIELERCASCGGPAALTGYKWYTDRGVIKNTHTGKRMAVLGSETDAIFAELEERFGKIIPRAVVEAQRRFVKTGFYSIEEVGDEGDIRTQLALRGLGELREIRMGKRGVRMRLDNAGLHLMVVGLVQGLFEMAFGIESSVEWELSTDGDLEVEVIPRRAKTDFLDPATL